MKGRIEKRKESGFEPFDLIITVESPEDLADLRRRFGIFLGLHSSSVSKGYLQDHPDLPERQPDTIFTVWKMLFDYREGDR